MPASHSQCMEAEYWSAYWAFRVVSGGFTSRVSADMDQLPRLMLEFFSWGIRLFMDHFAGQKRCSSSWATVA